MGAQVEEIIITNLYLEGNGTDEDPYRRVVQYWSKGGELLFTRDPYLIDLPKKLKHQVDRLKVDIFWLTDMIRELEAIIEKAAEEKEDSDG